MVKAIRVRYEGGVLKPLEEVDLREGEELVILIKSFKGFTKEVPNGIVEVEEDPIEKLIKERR